MKKNKKYWKEQAKNWRDYGLEMQELYFESLKDVDKAVKERDFFRRELSTLRQHTIGKKPYTSTTTGTNTNWGSWAIKYYNIPVGMDDKAKTFIEEAGTISKPKRSWRKRNK